MDPARLKSIDLFSGMSDEELRQLAAVAHETSVDEGRAVVRKGTWSYQLFAIEDGAVEVNRGGETVARLGAGDVVGETGAAERALRNATAVATSPLRLIYFTQADIGRLRKSMPDLDERLDAIVRERSAG